MSMLTRASFDNFKNLRRVDVDLSPFTVLVGPNGAGKTSVLQGLYLVTETVQRLKRGVEMTTLFSDDSPMNLLMGRFSPHRLATNRQEPYRLAISEGSQGSRATLQALARRPPEADTFSLELPGLQLNLVTNPLEPLQKTGAPNLALFPPSVLLQLDTERMVRPSVVEAAEPKLAPNGEGLASVLSYLAGAYPERKEAIEADVTAIVPWFRRVRVTPTKVAIRAIFEERMAREEDVWGHQFSVESKDGVLVPADLVSEGTVLVLGLLTLLHAPNPPRLLLIDDIDRALHLGAQVNLVRALRKLQEMRPELQIVASTHSPFLLQEFSADDVRVLGLTKDGVRCRALSAHPDYERWKSALGTGEIWANLGEDWVSDGA
jgi:hypothetical protein